jgi:hypothetical protein
MWVGIGVAVVLATVVGLVVYFVSYKFISRYQRDELRDSTSSLFRVVGMLVSLMLSLAFSEVIVQLKAIQSAVQREAVAISDMFDCLQRFDVESTREMRTILVDYTQAVIDDDWPALANDRLGQRAGALKDQFTDRVMELEPATAIQKQLLSRILADLDTASDYRLIRLDNALAEPPVFIYVVFFGFLITMACFGTYRPQVPLVVLVSLYTIFVGFMLYLILALSDPFQSGIGVGPTTFEHLVEKLQSGIGGRP